MPRVFVGADRVDSVDALAQAFATVVDGGGSRMVVLSAPTGFGKTKIVQEFYARLAKTQPMPTYWPARLEGDSSQRWTQTRKSVFPSSFTVPDGAELSWLWWGVSCFVRQDGRYAQALFDDVTQLAAHGGSLYDRLTAGDAAGRTFDGSSALISALGLLGVALVPPVAIGVGIVGAGRSVWQNKDLLTRFTKWRKERDPRRNEARVDGEGHGRGSQIREIAENVTAVSRKVPVVLVVDDAQWADSTLVEFIDTVLGNSQAQVLIVATTWPINDDTVDEFGPFQEWFAKTRRVDTFQDVVKVISLPSLSDDDVAALIRAEYTQLAYEGAPPLSGHVVDGVAALVGVTPMGVRALFGLERTRKLIGQGALTVDELGRLPRDLEDALRLYWDEVPRSVQTLLAMAAVAGFRFLPTPIIAAATAQGINDATIQLGQGQSPYSFVKGLDSDLAAFVDPIFFDTAYRAADDYFTTSQRDLIRQSIVEFALDVTLTDHAPAVCEAAWSAHITLAAEGFTDTELAAQSAFNLAQLSADRFEYTAAVLQAQRSLEWMPPTLAGHPNTLNTRNNLADWLGEAGRVDDAIAGFETLLADQLRVLGPDHPDTLSTRNNLAGWFGEAGRVDDAIVAFEMLRADRLRVLGPDHPDTLRTRNNLAAWFGEAGRVDDAIAGFETLLADQLRVLGPDHPDTLSNRRHLTGWLDLAFWLERKRNE